MTTTETSPYPRTNAAGETVWACCESSIGPTCAHRADPGIYAPEATTCKCQAFLNLDGSPSTHALGLQDRMGGRYCDRSRPQFSPLELRSSLARLIGAGTVLRVTGSDLVAIATAFERLAELEPESPWCDPDLVKLIRDGQEAHRERERIAAG